MSETPQQHGWQPPDLNDPADDAARPQRGFGVFEAPSVPDDFPAFTPYSAAARGEEFPPDSDEPSAFPGFPSEEAASSYVPAPAVVPIPGVTHEPYPSELPRTAPDLADPGEGAPAGSWAAFAAGDSPKAPSSPKPWEELSPFEASLDAAAAASTPSSFESPYKSPLAPSYRSSYESADEPPSYEASSDSSSSSYGSSSYETPSYESSSSSSSSSYEPPSYETPSYETPSYETPAYESSSSSSSSSYESPAYESSSYEPSSYETPSYESSSYEPSSYNASSYEPSSYESSYGQDPMPEVDPEPEQQFPSEPEPVFTPPPPPPPPASGSVRVAASVPPGIRVEPADLAEIPSQMPKSTGRVYGSAAAGASAVPSGSVPVSPGQGGVYTSSAGLYGQPPEQAAMPGSPGSVPHQGMPGSPAGMPGSPGVPVSPAPMPAAGDPSTGMVRATARVSGLAQPNPGESVPVAKSSTVYGSQMAAAAAPPAEAPAPGRGRQPAFGDLIEPVAGPPSIPMQRGPQGAVQMPPAPPAMPQGPGQPVVAPVDPSATRLDQFAGHPGQQGQPGMPGQPGQFGQPGMPGSHPGQPGMPGQPGQPGHHPGQPGQFGQPGLPGQPPPNRPMPAAAPEQKPERKGRLIIGVLVGCATLLAVAFGGLVLIDKLVGPAFSVGDCVKQSADKQEAIAASCSDEGAYKVVSSVGSSDECDQQQPYVKIDNEILCLQPAAAP